MTVMSSSKRIQTLLGPFDTGKGSIIVFKKYRSTYLSSVSRGGLLKTRIKLVLCIVADVMYDVTMKAESGY